MKKPRKQRLKKGFTLVEIIVAIAIVSLASTVILQLFTVATSRNERAALTDNALMRAQYALESFRQAETPKEALLPDYEWQGSDLRQGAAATAYFDRNWNRLPEQQKDAAVFALDAELSHIDPENDLSLPVKMGGSEQSVTAMYALSIKVTLFMRGQAPKMIVDLSAQKLMTFAANEKGEAL